MSLENYTGYIPALVITNPTATDPKSEGDDALRGIKKTLAMSFVGFTEPAQGVTVTASAINAIAGKGATFLCPTGSVLMHASENVPVGWFRCDGRLLNRVTYVDLFNQIGVAWGAGDGSTTFAIPDFRGYFARGVGAAGTPGGLRTLGSTQDSANEMHAHTVTITGGDHTHTEQGAGSHDHSVTVAKNSGATTSSGGGATTFLMQTVTTDAEAAHTHTINSASHTHTNTVSLEGDNADAHPHNKAIHFIIKT